MSDKKVNVGGREVVARELTVREVRGILDDLEAVKEVSTVDLLFQDRIPARAVALSTGLTLEELEGDFKPSELDAIITAVGEANPIFARLVERLTGAVKAVLSRGSA
jgi:hypothetical protein